jgi:hypothetical protein
MKCVRYESVIITKPRDEVNGLGKSSDSCVDRCRKTNSRVVHDGIDDIDHLGLNRRGAGSHDSDKGLTSLANRCHTFLQIIGPGSKSRHDDANVS